MVARCLPPPGATVFTVGYGGRVPDNLVALLKAHGIATIADVRLHPQKAMMGAYVKAKTPDKGIGRRLANGYSLSPGQPVVRRVHIRRVTRVLGGGIRYEWLGELGNPFMQDEDWADRYRELIATSGEERTARLLELKGPVCLLCSEKRPEDCRRRIVAEWLAEWGWKVTHLV